MSTRPWGRDLLAELDQKHDARPSCEEDDQEPDQEPVEESPTKRMRLQADDLPLIREVIAEAQFDASKHACIIVVVDDGFADTTVQKGVKDDV